MTENTDIKYNDQTGKPINVDDRIHYSNKEGINVAWVKELLPNEEGIKIRGKNNKRDCVIKQTDKKVIVVSKGYYENNKRAQKRNAV